MNGAKTSSVLPKSSRWFALALLFPVLIAVLWARRPAILAGDGPEYFLMLEAWTEHASPDLRHADFDVVQPMILKNSGLNLVNPEAGYMLSIDGKWFCYHFWMYPLFATPARAVLSRAGANPFESFHVLNVFLFAIAIAAAIRYFPGSPFRRWAFVALSVVSPVLWYLAWPHSEVYSWSFVLVSVVAYARKRPAIAAGCAAMAALQNSPLVFLAFAYVLDPLAQRRWRSAALTLACAGIAAISPVFYFVHYHVPSPFIAVGQASAKYASAARVVSMLVDLSDGMLPFAPGVLILGVVGTIAAVRKRAWPGVIAPCVLLAMMAASTESVNWNHGCAGILRYAIWMLPIFAGLAATYLPDTLRVKIAVIVAVIAQLAIVERRDGHDDSLEYSALARFVLERAPSLYNPDPEIFVERTSQQPTMGSADALPLPTVFARGREATKFLTDNAHVPGLLLEYDAAPGYLASVRALRPTYDGMYYVSPPHGALTQLETIDAGIPVGHGATLGAGWSPADPKRGDRATRAMGDAADLQLRTIDADMVLTIDGTMPEGVTDPTMRVTLGDGTEIDRFVASSRDIERTIAIDRAHANANMNANVTGALTATIHTSQTNGERVGFLLRRVSWEMAPPPDPRAVAVRLVSGFYPPEHNNDMRWMTKRAEIEIAPHDGPATLRIRGWPPERYLSGAPTFRVAVDDREIAHFLAFSWMDHEYALPPNASAPTRVTFETSATGAAPIDTRALGYFFEKLTVTRDAR